MNMSLCTLGFVFSLHFIAADPINTSPAALNSNKVSFTENRGQMYDQHGSPRPDVLFSGESNGMEYHLRKNGISYQLRRVDNWKEEVAKGIDFKVPGAYTIYRVDLNWPGSAENPLMETEGEQAGYNNYFRSVCPNGVYNVKTYTGVTYKAVYPGIDLHYYNKNGILKYDYIVSAGANYKQIKIEVKGASRVAINKKGKIEITTPLGLIVENAPMVIQNGHVLKSCWVLQETTLSFDIQGLIADRPFTIDPAVRVWGTYYGNSSDEKSWEVSTDPLGNVFMAGEAASGGLATSGAHQTLRNGGRDAFLVKFNSNGVRKWATYYGSIQGPGGPAARGYACATDVSGNIFMSGTAPASPSTEIATLGCHQPTLGGSLYDAFLVKFDSSGVRLWGTYYGGNAHESADGCATDASGNVYIVGSTQSSIGIATPGSHQPSYSGGYNAFIAKFNAAGVRQWATYYGSDASAQTCEVDPGGNLIVAGHAGSLGVFNIATAASHQPTHGGDGEAWVAKFNSSGLRQWGTYYGGAGYEQCHSCAVDCSGNIFLSGHTNSASATNSMVMTTPGAFQTTYAGGYVDGFLVKFNSSGVRQWGTLYGSNLHDNQYGCATDVEGNVYIAGYLFANFSLSGSGLATPGAHQTFMPGPASAYLAKFSGSGQRLWGTYYGFDGISDSGGAFACTTHSAGSIYLTGIALNPFVQGTFTYVATPGSHQPNFGSPWNQSGYYYDAFLVRFYESISTPTTVVNVTSTHSLLCTGGSATLTASGASNYSWSPVGTGTTVVISPTISTTYIVSGDDACQAAIFTQSVVTLPAVLLSTNRPEMCRGVSATITASGAWTYVWQPAGSGSSMVITPSVTTTYTVTGTDINNCSNTATLTQVVNSCAGVSEESGNSGVHIYPNPAKNILTIEFRKKFSISIYNEIGQLILQTSLIGGNNQLDISELKAGIYLIKAFDGEKLFVNKFIKDN